MNSESAIGQVSINFQVKIKRLFCRRRKTESTKKDKGNVCRSVCLVYRLSIEE